jgi:predicted DNA-binding transcriptional regulator YafY
MVNLAILDQSFTRPANFTMDHLEEDDKRTLIIKALFDQSIASEVREWRSYYLEGMQDTPEGLLVTLRVHYENEVVNWLLGWGGNIRILEPESLKRRLVREAKKIIANHRKAK